MSKTTVSFRYSYSKLLGRIKEKGYTLSSFSAALGMDASSLYNKLKGKSGFKQAEIANACNILDIPIENLALYFFTRILEKSQENESQSA